MKKRLRELEEMVIDAWPASHTLELDGWLLRASGGPSHRGNSVATTAAGFELPLDERIAQAEAWYRERGQPAMFQVGPCAEPKELDAALAERGYRKEGEAMFASAPPRVVQESIQLSAALHVQISERITPGFQRAVMEAGRFGAHQTNLLSFVRRLGTRCRFACAYAGGNGPEHAVAGCLAIASEDRLGLYAMHTLPEARRQGAARSLLQGLAEGAQRELMRELYLLVETANQPARALYARCGFVDQYSYHYRLQSEG